MAQITILGPGGFGIALACMLDRNGHSIRLWTAFEDEFKNLTQLRENTKLLAGIKIADSVEITMDTSCASDCDILLIAVPSFAVRSVCQSFNGKVSESAVITCVSKGIEDKTYKRLSEVISEEFPKNDVVMLSGPSHAEEVAKGVPTAVVAASKKLEAAQYVQDVMMNSAFRIYTNDDVAGVELGGAVKNIIAIAAGVIDGLNMGDNTKAALMTRGLTEIARLGKSMGARESTFAGLSGIGDLIVTCTSAHSRNNRAGRYIGQGMSVSDALAKVGQTVEGYHAAKTAYELSVQKGVEMPIVHEIYEALYNGKAPADAVVELMGREKKHESEAVWFK